MLLAFLDEGYVLQKNSSAVWWLIFLKKDRVWPSNLLNTIEQVMVIPIICPGFMKANLSMVYLNNPWEISHSQGSE